MDNEKTDNTNQSEKIRALKEALQDKTYRINPDLIAEALLDRPKPKQQDKHPIEEPELV